jgi:sulfatase maturation enzyme AslB (radical SAM superfamily)
MEYGFAKMEDKFYPPMVVVSITNVCNQRCIHCYHKTFKKDRSYSPNFMDVDLWMRICASIPTRYQKTILNIGCDGEPFLHPDLYMMLHYARSIDIAPINITTNGTLLNTSAAIDILKEGLIDVLNVSIDAFDEETYKKIRGGDLNHVLRNVMWALSIRESHSRASDMKVQVNIIDQPESGSEVEDFMHYWESKVDNVLVRTYYDATNVTGETGGNITGKQKEFPEEERWPCQQLWRRFNISDDGIAHFCVDDWHKKTAIGDLTSLPPRTIPGIWNSTHYNELRTLHLEGRFDEIPYCAKCTEWQGMRWDYDYFTAMEKMLGEKMI